MTMPPLKYTAVGALVLVALVAGGWFFFAPPEEAQAMRGSISGTVLYPSDFIPPLRVCAVPVDGPDTAAVCTDTEATTEESPPGSDAFAISKVPPGDYYVYAQIKDPTAIGADIPGTYKAYYDEFVRCGLRFDCKDTTRIVVHVTAGADTPGIKPHDWYH